MSEFTKENIGKMLKKNGYIESNGVMIIGFTESTNFMKHYGETSDTSLFNLKKEDKSNLNERYVILQRIKKA